MAEILISLTIIGIIAAITLPALQANINEKTWATQKKALYSRMSQAIAMMDSLNGYGIGETDALTEQKAAQAFIADGLSKVLKISNICDNENLKKCGFPDEIRKFGKNVPKIVTPKKLTELNNNFNANGYSPLDTSTAAFETVNGESILTFYNPACVYDNLSEYTQLQMCANFLFDLNGRKGPNQVGKDIGFITAFYPSDSEIVMPYTQGSENIRQSQYPEFSIALGNKTCRKVYGKNARMANIQELQSVWINNNLGHRSSSAQSYFLVTVDYVSSTISDGKVYGFHAGGGRAKVKQYDIAGYHSLGGTDMYNYFYCVN